ncbi:MAG: ABC transporter ATP-binding protein [Bacteroidota bacterium]
MRNIVLKAERVSKNFNRRNVLRDISFVLSPGESLAVTGKNGSGKSTLVKILAGLLSPTSGLVVFEGPESRLNQDEIRPLIGFVSPYLQLYDEFSAVEILDIVARIRMPGAYDQTRRRNLLEQFNLWGRKDDAVRTYSSGMKQRLKYVLALEHSPAILLLDEPTANLDEDGIGAVRSVVAEYGKSGALVVATNDAGEAGWCSSQLKVGS